MSICAAGPRHTCMRAACTYVLPQKKAGLGFKKSRSACLVKPATPPAAPLFARRHKKDGGRRSRRLHCTAYEILDWTQSRSSTGTYRSRELEGCAAHSKQWKLLRGLVLARRADANGKSWTLKTVATHTFYLYY